MPCTAWKLGLVASLLVLLGAALLFWNGMASRFRLQPDCGSACSVAVRPVQQVPANVVQRNQDNARGSR